MGARVSLLVALAAAACLGSPPGADQLDAAPPDGADAAPPAVDAAATLDCSDPPLAPFSDDFASEDLAWAVPPRPGRSGVGAIAMAVGGGELVFEPGAAGGDHAWLQTEPFDFTAARVVARVTQLTTDGSSQPYLGIIGPAGEERLFTFDGTRLWTPNVGTLYLEGVHVWWQLSSEEGVLHYQTSEDGLTWVELDAAPAGFALDAVQFEVGINVEEAGAAERGAFAIDDLDRPPCAE